MYRCGSMSRSASLCAALIFFIGCAPKQVESPLEKAPPAEIAQARELASNGQVRGAQNAYESFIIGHQGTAEADLARLELGMLDAELDQCPRAIPHLEQAQQSADRAIGLRASLHLAMCQLKLGDRAVQLGDRREARRPGKGAADHRANCRRALFERGRGAPLGHRGDRV